jgi:hypothetical protein
MKMRLIDLGLLCLFPVLFVLFRAFDRKEWVGLTDEEILTFQDKVPNTYSFDLIEFANAIEAKLKEKNT